MKQFIYIECVNVFKKYSYSISGIKFFIISIFNFNTRNIKKSNTKKWTLSNINFSINAGTAFAIIGHNGAGKSTLLSLLLGTMLPDLGNIIVKGKVASLLDLGAGFHPELTGKENIYLYGSILGMTLNEINSKFEFIVEFSDLYDYIDKPIKIYSNGMIARLGFSIVISSPAEIFLIDEILAVGDSKFQKKCIDYLIDFKNNGGILVIVSHQLELLLDICEYGVCINQGEQYYQGKIEDVIDIYESIMKC